MSRLDPPTNRFARLSAPVVRRVYGRDLSEAAAHGHHPRLLCALMLFNRAVEKEDVVPRRLKELASLQAGALIGCPWCLDFGSHVARGHGISDKQLLHLHEAHGSGLFDAEELLVIDFTTAMTVTPPQVDDELVAAVRERFGVTGLIELTHMVAWENHRSRVNVALGLEADGFSDGAACARAQVPQRSGLSG
ncbi:MAG: carboxymuconolactone decarboxylase family protein [Actinomycetota bacterium]|nr:carboxymuconolactone decarboxylase family protein [Actinomycetota bacterium]